MTQRLIRTRAFAPWRFAWAAGLLLGLAQGAQAQDGAYLAKDCMACHDSAQGRNQGIPSIVGQKREFLRARLDAFRRPGSDAKLMPRLMAAYTSDEIEQIAAYLSTRPSPLMPVPDAGPKSGVTVAGLAKYRAHCAACHEHLDASPLLRGQNRAYLVNALRDFVFGRRAMPDGMRDSLSGLSAEDLGAVIDFMASSKKDKE
ncbi:c-type cytochrome [Variovorax boronicumulans]|uniref:c-type cytochrome n=1 Tax=Variovorax boronicumulans TaxID=436515 RepID=UPI00339A0299